MGCPGWCALQPASIWNAPGEQHTAFHRCYIIKSFSKIPVIISSGLSDTQVALNAISLGAQDFLIKSDHDHKLLEKAVRYSIERKKNLEIIEENIERHNTISKATNDIIWDWDLVTNKVLWRGIGLKNYLPENKDKLFGISKK